MTMDDPLFRLAWALPLVIAVGIGAIYGLKRLGYGQMPAATRTSVEVLSTTVLSDQSRVILIEHQRQQFLVFESSAQIQVQPIGAQAVVGVQAPSWLSRRGPRA